MRNGFTLVEIMTVVSIIGMLAAIAVPKFVKSRERAQIEACQNNQRVIWQGIKMYVLEEGGNLTPAEWPNLCATRNRLAPGGNELYVNDWRVFECPVRDSQDKHDYAYVFENGVMTGVRCNNTSAAVRNLHNGD